MAKCHVAQDLWDAIFPINSTVTRYDTVNPATLYGGTWVQLPANYYLYTASSSPGETGGSSDTGGTAITQAQMPSHTHSMGTAGEHTHNTHWRFSGGSNTAYNIVWYNSAWQGPYDNALGAFWMDSAGGHNHTLGNIGSNQAHTHTIDPVRIKVVVWRRTA